MIRHAAHEDIPAIVAWGREFYAMSPHKGMGEFDPAAVARMLRFMIDSPQAIVLTNGRGAIGGVYAPVYFDPSKWILEESFWWSKAGGRDLLRAAMKAGKEWGASFMLLSTLENERSEAIDRLVTAMGFERLERRYLKGLS